MWVSWTEWGPVGRGGRGPFVARRQARHPQLSFNLLPRVSASHPAAGTGPCWVSWALNLVQGVSDAHWVWMQRRQAGLVMGAGGACSSPASLAPGPGLGSPLSVPLGHAPRGLNLQRHPRRYSAQPIPLGTSLPSSPPPHYPPPPPASLCEGLLCCVSVSPARSAMSLCCCCLAIPKPQQPQPHPLPRLEPLCGLSQAARCWAWGRTAPLLAL